jgi:hypothetical protein
MGAKLNWNSKSDGSIITDRKKKRKFTKPLKIQLFYITTVHIERRYNIKKKIVVLITNKSYTFRLRFTVLILCKFTQILDVYHGRQFHHK